MVLLSIPRSIPAFLAYVTDTLAAHKLLVPIYYNLFGCLIGIFALHSVCNLSRTVIQATYAYTLLSHVFYN